MTDPTTAVTWIRVPHATTFVASGDARDLGRALSAGEPVGVYPLDPTAAGVPEPLARGEAPLLELYAVPRTPLVLICRPPFSETVS
jgi:hypothetical protein